MTDTWTEIAIEVMGYQCATPVRCGHVSKKRFGRFQREGQKLAGLERAMLPEEFKAYLSKNQRYGAEWGNLIPLICGWRLWTAGVRQGPDRVEYLAQANECAGCGASEALHLHHVIQRPPRLWLATESIFALCESCHTKAHQGEL